MDTQTPPAGGHNGGGQNGTQQNGGAARGLVQLLGQSQKSQSSPDQSQSRSTGAGAQTDADRHDRLFEWAFKVLTDIGLIDAIANASSMEELQRIIFDPDATKVIVAIQEALKPPDRQQAAAHFHGLTAKVLTKVLRNRFTDLKKDREKQLLNPGRSGTGPQSDWTDDLIFRKDGKIEPNLANITLMLRTHPAWAGVLAFSEFAANIIIRQQPPWGPEPPDTLWTNLHTTKTSIWLVRNGMAAPGKDKIIDAVEAVAKEQGFHPVRDYLDGLNWGDGVVRAPQWLQTYFKVKDSPYVQAIGPRILISAVARIYEPGCKVDHVPIAEGPQGRKKSQLVEALVPNPEWFADQLSNVANKDAKVEVAGVWIMEIAEMEALTRATSSAAKKFITNKKDRFRPPYGRHLITWARQLVFFGTYNRIPGEGYLKDPTGARRFWAFECAGDISEADVERLKQDRDLLWAEAVARYRAGEKWWLETPELEALATAEQEARFARDDWEQPIQDWLIETRLVEVTPEQVLRDGLGLSHSHSGEIRVVKILKRRLGFKQLRVGEGKDDKGNRVRYRCYVSDLPLETAPEA